MANVNGKTPASRPVVTNRKTDSGTIQDNASKKPNDSTTKKSGKATKTSSSSSSSSESDSDSSSSDAVATPAKASQAATHLPKVGTTAVPAAVSESTTARTTKKRRISESGNAVATAIATETSSPAPNQSGKANGTKPRKSNTPFQRVKADAVEFHDERLKDNAFVARVCLTILFFVHYPICYNREAQQMTTEHELIRILSLHEATVSGRRKTKRSEEATVAEK